MRFLWLPEIPDDDDEITDEEKNFRIWLIRGYRFLLAVFLSFMLFDFLFSPLWMHGYLWSLNQPIDVDLADKSAGFISDRQLEYASFPERVLYSILSVLAVCVILRFSGYFAVNRSVWHLFGLSLVCGAATGLIRCQQLQHRLFSILHESFYMYLHFFVVGVTMTLQPFEKFPTPETSTKNSPDKTEKVE